MRIKLHDVSRVQTPFNSQVPFPSQKKRLHPLASCWVAMTSLAVASLSPGAACAQSKSSSKSVEWAGMDSSVSPGDDFFEYANGGWVKSTPIPPDKPGWGTFYELAEDATRRTHELLQETVASSPASGSEQRKIADYYATFMNEAAIEAKGTAPLAPALARIAQISDRKSLAQALGAELRADVDPLNATKFQTDRLFGVWVAPNCNAPKEYAPYLLQGGLGMPDREYYLSSAAPMVELRSKYLAHIATMFKLAGISSTQADAMARAGRVMALETKMAQVHGTRESSEDVIKANNPWNRVEFAAKAPGLDWDALFSAAGLDKAGTIIVWHPGATRGLSALVANEPLPAWRDWLAFHAVEHRSAMLPKAFASERFAFYDQALYGIPQMPERWKRAVFATNNALGDAVGQLYVRRYFPPESKAVVQEMVKNIRLAFAERIDKLAWMAPATKAKAKEKLTTLYVGVGYPDHWIQYNDLQVVPGDAVGNIERAQLFEYRRQLAKLGRPVDLTEWAMTPQTVNALNLPLQNALNFPAAILRPPFFDPSATSAENYGAIGATIGHEISHSFDDQGAQFDAHGRLSDWWTKEDREHFEASGAKLARQYDAYRPLPDLHINGKLTLSENIADLAGLAATHDAWKKSLAGKPAPASTKGFTAEQLFFLSYDRSWRGKAREPALRQQIITDPHAPEKYRGHTVRNLDAWYPAFDVKPGLALFLSPKDRVQVW